MRKLKRPDNSDGPVFISVAQTDWKGRARAAINDLRRGLDLYLSWTYLAINDTKHSSRRTRLGPFWHTMGFALMVIIIGYVWSRMSSMPPERFFRYFASGFFMFQFLSMVAVNGFGCFIFGGGYVSNSALPVSFFLFWHYAKILFILALQLPILILILVINGAGTSPRVLEAALGFTAVTAVCVIFGFSVGLLFTRFRDLLEISRNSLRLAFILTPIIWAPEDMFARFSKLTGGEPSFWVPFFTIWVNPFYHMIEVFRAPLLGSAFPFWSWVYVGGMLVLGVILFFVVFARYRSRIVFWV